MRFFIHVLMQIYKKNTYTQTYNIHVFVRLCIRFGVVLNACVYTCFALLYIVSGFVSLSRHCLFVEFYMLFHFFATNQESSQLDIYFIVF